MSNTTELQIPENLREVIENEVDGYGEGAKIEELDTIPDTPNIPIEDPQEWLRVPNVICVYVDMQNSTRLSATNYDRSTASAYRLFTRTAVRLFNEIDVPYIDVRGDGVFALFNEDQPYTAVAAAVTFKTFASEDFAPRVRDRTGVDVGSHLGIDQNTVLVRKMGLKRYKDRTDRQNEVWAGRPVNMAAKLASLSDHDELLVSGRFFENLDDPHVLYSCGCDGKGNKIDKKYLWDEVSLEDDDRFDFDTAHRLESKWCSVHGKSYCEEILSLDD